AGQLSAQECQGQADDDGYGGGVYAAHCEIFRYRGREPHDEPNEGERRQKSVGLKGVQQHLLDHIVPLSGASCPAACIDSAPSRASISSMVSPRPANRPMTATAMKQTRTVKTAAMMTSEPDPTAATTFWLAAIAT